MVSREYAKEIGLNVTQKTVPWPAVLALIAVIVSVGGYGFHATWPAPHEAHGAKKATTTASAASVAGAVAVAGK